MLALYQETLISTARRFLPGQSKKKKNHLQKKKPKSTRMGEMHQPLQETNIYQEFWKKDSQEKKCFCLFCFDFGVNFLYNI